MVVSSHDAVMGRPQILAVLVCKIKTAKEVNLCSNVCSKTWLFFAETSEDILNPKCVFLRSTAYSSLYLFLLRAIHYLENLSFLHET